jgi:hypothetical protein
MNGAKYSDMKTCSRALRASDWDKGSPSNRTTTLSRKPRHTGVASGQVSEYSLVAQPEPGLKPDLTSLARPENSCAATLPIQPDSLRGSTENNGRNSPNTGVPSL